MKKLISAVSALAMAASMTGAAVPFVTGAADATKGFELRTFANKAGEAVSTTISEDEIAAGDVTIPVGVYLTEKTADISFISAQWAVNSKDGDASNAYVKFKGYAPNDDYFNSNQTVTAASGETFDTNKIVGFCGTLKAGKTGNVGFSDTSDSSMYSIEDSQPLWGAENAWGSVVWSRPVSQDSYDYTGTASDSFPMCVFEVTFAKGTPAGTYSIDFIDMERNSVYATYIEAGSPMKTYSLADKSLTVKNLDIVIGGAASSTPATTAPAAAATTTPAVTTKPAQEEDEGFPINDNFVVSMAQDYEAEPGDTVTVDFIVSNPNGHLGSTFAVEMGDLADGWTAEITDATCLAVDPDGIKDYYKLVGGKSYQASVLDKNSDPVPIADGEIIVTYDITIPADATPGDYEIGLQKFRVVEFATTKAGPYISKFDAKLVGGKITVKGDAPITTAPATTPATTAPAATTAAPAPATTATPAPATTAPAQTGDVLYGDTNVDGKVNIADVVVLNKWLNNNADYAITAQGKVNADCCDAKGGEGLDKNDSDAIIRSIVHLVTLPCAAADLK